MGRMSFRKRMFSDVTCVTPCLSVSTRLKSRVKLFKKKKEKDRIRINGDNTESIT